MAAYELKTETCELGGDDYLITSLVDTNQAPESYEDSRAAGIPDAYWALFGVVWDVSRTLANHVATLGMSEARTLEIGCGLALPGIVAHRRGMDITVSDVHPLTEKFLHRNCDANELSRMDYLTLDWTQQHPDIGKFDRILASDVCYLPEHPADLLRFVDHHGSEGVDVIVADPGRTPSRRMRKAFREGGFDAEVLEHAGPGGTIVTTYRRR